MAVIAVLTMVAMLLAGCGQEKNTQGEKPATDTTPNKEDEKIVATIGDDQITASDLNFFLRQMEMQYEYMYGPDVWDQEVEGKTVAELTKENALQVAEQYTIFRIIGKKEGLSIPQEQKDQMDEIVTSTLAQFGEDSGVTADAIKRAAESESYGQQIFDKELAEFPIDQEELNNILNSNRDFLKFTNYEVEDLAKKVRARHILISTMDEQNQPLVGEEADKKKTLAEEVLGKVKAGEDFATLAKEYSEDPGSKDNGGEYTFARGEMVKEFEDSAFGMEPGEHSELVKTQYGYHIIKLEEVIEATDEAIQTVKDQKQKFVDDATMQIKQQEFQKRFDEWKKDYEVKLNQDVFDAIEVRQSRNETNDESEDGTDGEDKPADDTDATDGEDKPADDTESTDSEDKPADESEESTDESPADDSKDDNKE